MATVPQVPEITVPQSAQGSSALDGLLTNVSQAASAPLPPMYSQGTNVSQPTLPQVRQAPVLNQNVQPISMQVQDLKRARTQNAVAGLANVINRGAQEIQQRKQDALKTRLVDVMQAKQNVANAQAVLQQDPNNKLAQGVMQANKKRLNDILSDPKHAKEMQKALDISFVDPEQNKTPEVQAFQQAHKEVQQAGPFNASNPQEAQVAKMASQGGKPQAPAQQPAQKSATPYADAALAKDLPSIQENPQYAAALQQKQAAEKALWTNVIPAAVRARAQQQTALIQQGHADARANLAAVVSYHKTEQGHIDKLSEIDAQGKKALSLEAQRYSNNRAVMQMHIDAMKDIADKKLNDPASKQKMGQMAINEIDKSIQGMSQTRNNLLAAKNQADTADDKKQSQLLTEQIAQLDRNLDDTQKYRTKTAESFYGTPAHSSTTKKAPAATQNGQGLIPKGFFDIPKGTPIGMFGIGPQNVGSAGSATTQLESGAGVESVGQDQSDESDDTSAADPQDDSDAYGNP